MSDINITHTIREKYGCEIVYLYVDLNMDTEFSKDFFNFKKEEKSETSFISKIREYAKSNLEDKRGIAAVIVVNGAIIGSLAIMSLLLPFKELEKDKTYLGKNQEIIETVEPIKPSEENKKEAAEEKKEEVKIEESNTSVEEKPASNNNQNNSNSSSSSGSNSNNNNNNNGGSNNNQENVVTGKTVKVKLTNGQVLTLGVEEYVVGVVGSEMPASFSNEALKAQAIAARTYGLKKSESGKVLLATTSDQVYKTNAQLQAQWGGEYTKYYNKVKNAVYATEGLVLTYGGKYIDALYFSTSNGKTEDPSYVWNYSVPYLKPVDSSFDVNTTPYKRTADISYSTMTSKLGINVDKNTKIEVLSRTSGNRVNTISIGGKVFTGVKIRSLFGLRSTDFEFAQGTNGVTVTTKGYGHGVGMSQYGANEMAKSGNTYSQILKHYYTGVSIVKK